jgi:diguanylate cyclase (GGDEF)-like protein
MDRHKGDKAVKTLAEVMSVAPLTVDRRASVLSALEVMRERRISSVLVGEPDDPQGIITERDLVGWLHRRLDLNVATCGDVMHGPLLTLPDTASYIEAHHEMAQRGIRHLGVRNADGRVVGMVSESDILGAIGVEYFTEFKSVRNLMTPVVCTLPPDARVSDAVDLMNRERQTSVVVVDEENRPIGLLTERDIVRLAVEGTTPLDSALRVAASRPVRTVSADGLVHEAVATMENLRIRRLVVVDNDGQVVGLLSQHEIVSGLENQYIRLLKNVIDRQNLHQRNTAQPLNERAMLDSLLAAHPDGLSILTDHDYVVQAANPAACDVLRVSVDDLIGGDLAALLAQIGVSAELPLAAAKLSGEAVIEAAPRADDGADEGDSNGKTLELRIRRLSHPDHGLQGYLITGRDLSERRQAEEALLAERDFSDAIIAGLPGLFYLIDEDGRLLRWNSAWREFGDAAGRSPRHGALLEDLLGLEAASEVEKIRWAVRQTEAEIETTVRMKSDDSRVYLHKLRRVDIGRRHLLIGSAIDITKSKRSMAEAERLARIDTLTGLPNRHAFIERLSAALAISDGETAHTALLFLDIDNFKNVNDTLGHVVGDSLLRAAGHRLERVAAGRGAELARLGGDEFALIKTGDWTDGAPEELAGAVVDSLSRPFSIDGHQIFVGASVGIVVYPGDYVEKSDLLAQADLAMYRAKAAGRSCWRRFEAWMAIDAQRRRLIESELREAVHRDQFELYYQPKLALGDGRITGAEALIRWRHPALGMINPDEFIGLAESTGLIAPVGEWVLHAACMEAARWAAAGRPLKVAVNVSPVQFLRHDLVGAVREALDASGLPPTLLELEVTENAVVADAAKAQAILDQVTALGVTIAMDDFGAGYSSLAQLRRLRFNTLKIDRSLVSPLGSDADALAVIATVVALGDGLGMTVVAEGIETATHLEILKDVGCHEGQGFHFWRPLPAPLFRDIIADA